MYKDENEAPILELPYPVILEMAIRAYVGEICIFCEKQISREQMDTTKWAPWSKGRVCHGSEWNLEKYQTLLERERTK